MSDSNNPDAAGNRVVSMRINLSTGANADQPIYTNYSALELAAGTLFMDFGFLEPRVISAVAAAARQGAKLPEQLNGKLVARLVLNCSSCCGFSFIFSTAPIQHSKFFWYRSAPHANRKQNTPARAGVWVIKVGV